METNQNQQEQNKAEQVQPKAEQTTPKPEGLGYRFLETMRGYTDLFSKSLFTPSVITVLITAILAPFVVDKINSDMENKKLQKQVIEKMLDYTAQTDFSQPEALEKITIISKMVDENKSIFGLSFSETDNVIQNLYGEISKVGLSNLNKKRKEYESKIQEIKTQLSGDTLQILNLQLAKTELEEKVATARVPATKDQFNKELLALNAKLQPLLEKKSLLGKQIQYWEEQIASLNRDIAGAQQDLATLLQSKREREAELQRSLANKSEIEEKFKELVNQNQKLNEQITKMDTLNSALFGQIESMKKELEAYKLKEAEAAGK